MEPSALKESIKRGEQVYKTACMSCHQANGEGQKGAFPPLAGSEWVMGPSQNLINITLHGLKGKIEVKGDEYNGVMIVATPLDDTQISDVLNYVRGNWGNSGRPITVEQVKTLRDKKPPVLGQFIDASELLPSTLEVGTEEPPKDFSQKITGDQPDAPFGIGFIVAFVAAAAVSGAGVFFGLATRNN